MPEIFLNCDLGEWESHEQSAALMPFLHMANIACGGHAGDAASIARCSHLANTQRPIAVSTGAHPGLPPELSPDRGRSLPDDFTVQQFTQLLELQLHRFITNADLNHIKLHGALYHLTENDPQFRHAFLECVKRKFLITIVCQAGGAVEAAASARDLPVTPEIFLDRNYAANGQLLPRQHPEAIIHEPAQVTARLEQILQHNRLTAIDGTALPLSGDYDHITACVHSDSPNSLDTLQAARTFLDLHQ
ncbi:LamB/YcsF family protein [Rubritalea marina]|uniref:LamB/YcsF family protein n=1 Tax=Rubritalea marina TaxID=361055 RepID=UPI0003748AA2|nr:LamB/YcsF family protein [Rubritalea marina]